MKSDPLRIAQVAPLWTRIPPSTYGGTELLLKLLVDDLVARGHDVTLFATGDCQTAGKLHAVAPVNMCELIERGEAYVYEYYANAAVAEALRAAAHFDVIHFHVGCAWLPLATLTRTPSLFTMHTTPHLDDEWALRTYPGVAVAGISDFQMHGPGVRLGRAFPTVYNGCDFDAFEPSFEPGKYLAFLGRMSPDKNPLGAIRIAQAVDMPIVLAGQPQNGKEVQYFQEQIQPLIDGERVKWVGPVNPAQKSELLRHAAALVFPILWDEPFGLVMIEAMACGTPVIAHRRGSVSEVVNDGITGCHTAVIDAMPDLVPRALALDRRTVREHARGRFGYQRMVDDYLALYRQLAR